MLERFGKKNTRPNGESLELQIEAKPGGRWYRDLADNNGHLWGFVQAIKRPTLLEINGPLFMSYPIVNNVQYRLSEVEGGTLIKFHHKALGLIVDEHRTGVVKGWAHILAGAKSRAEQKRK